MMEEQIEQVEQIESEIRGLENIMQQSLLKTVAALSQMALLQTNMLAVDGEENKELEEAAASFDSFSTLYRKMEELELDMRDN